MFAWNSLCEYNVIAASLVSDSCTSGECVSTNDFAELIKEVRISLPSLSLPLSLSLSLSLTPSLSLLQAIDGFLIVLDKEANILYVSDSISDYVGLTQVGTHVHVHASE